MRISTPILVHDSPWCNDRRVTGVPTMSLENVDDIYPLTPMQRLMLMHSLRSPGTSTLANQFRYRLCGALDESRFVDAWERVVARHDALRTAFVWEEVPQPLQVVRSQVKVPMEFIDLRDASEATRSVRLEEILGTDRVRGFDLRRTISSSTSGQPRSYSTKSSSYTSCRIVSNAILSAVSATICNGSTRKMAHKPRLTGADISMALKPPRCFSARGRGEAGGPWTVNRASFARSMATRRPR